MPVLNPVTQRIRIKYGWCCSRSRCSARRFRCYKWCTSGAETISDEGKLGGNFIETAANPEDFAVKPEKYSDKEDDAVTPQEEANGREKLRTRLL